MSLRRISLSLGLGVLFTRLIDETFCLFLTYYVDIAYIVIFDCAFAAPGHHSLSRSQSSRCFIGICQIWFPPSDSALLDKNHEHLQVETLTLWENLMSFAVQCVNNVIHVWLSFDSARMVSLVPLLLKSNSAKCLVEDYAACLESRFDELQLIENYKDDAGVLILQVSQKWKFFCLWHPVCVWFCRNVKWSSWSERALHFALPCLL